MFPILVTNLTMGCMSMRIKSAVLEISVAALSMNCVAQEFASSTFAASSSGVYNSAIEVALEHGYIDYDPDELIVGPVTLNSNLTLRFGSTVAVAYIHSRGSLAKLEIEPLVSTSQDERELIVAQRQAKDYVEVIREHLRDSR